MSTSTYPQLWRYSIAWILSGALCLVSGYGILILFMLVLLAALTRKITWRQLGFTTPESWPHLFFKSVWVGVSIQLLFFYAIDPTIEYATGQSIDLTSFENIRGNITYLFLWMLFVWGVVIFVEEIVFRGWLYHAMTSVFSSFTYKRWIFAIITSLLFGLAHSYQGPSGMISTGLMSLFLVGCFEWERKTIWFPIIIHGIIDTVGLLFIYFDWMPL